MILLLHAPLGPRLSGEAFARLARLLSPAQAAELGGFRRWQDAQARLLGRLLLRRGLERLGLDPELARQALRDAQGRPHLPQGPDFNLSHSGGLVALALGWEVRLGLDLEEVRPLPLEDFRSTLSQAEWRELEGLPRPWERFLELWTAKESVLKAQGQGLMVPMDEVCLRPGGALLRGQPWHLLPQDLEPGYKCHLCLDRLAYDTIIKYERCPAPVAWDSANG